MSALTSVPSHLVTYAGAPDQLVIQSETLHQVTLWSSPTFGDPESRSFWRDRTGSLFDHNRRVRVSKAITLTLPKHTPKIVTRRVGFGCVFQSEYVAEFRDGQFRIAWVDFPDNYLAERGRHQVLRDGVSMMGADSVNSISENRAEFHEHTMRDLANMGQFSRPGYFHQDDRRIVAFFVGNRRYTISLEFSMFNITERFHSNNLFESLFDLAE